MAMIPALAPATKDCTADDPAMVEKALRGAATTVPVVGDDPIDLTAMAFCADTSADFLRKTLVCW